MDLTPIPLPSDPELPAEPPLARPARPGPNFFMALVWWLLFLGAQLLVGVGASALLAVMAVLEYGQRGFETAMRDSPDAALFNVRGAAIVLFLFATGGNLLVAGLIVAILFRSQVRRAMALRRPSLLHCGLSVLMAPPLLIVGSEVQTLAMRVLPQFHGNDELYAKLAQEPWIVILLLGALLPALGEELFFRGFLSRGLVAKHGLVFGVLVASALFGITHMNPPQVVGTAVLALAFQAAFLSSKSLFAPILLHTLNNGIAFALMRLVFNPHTRDVFGLNDNTLIPPVLALAALLALFAVGWMFFETRTQWVLQDGQIWSPGYITAEMPPAHLAAKPQMASPGISTILVMAGAYALFLGILFWEIGG
jgi:membrane protease YdiL (CAAX protease family)